MLAKEVLLYLWIALVLNTMIVFISFIIDYYEDLPFLLQNNTIEYNILSVSRTIIFSIYFIRNGPGALKPLKRMVVAFFLGFVLFNFIVLESPVNLFSSGLFTAESIVLLFFCIYYYLTTINQERDEKLSKHPMFWIVMGLSIYEAVNFFIFLLFKYLIENYTVFAQKIWNIHDISYIVFCLLITRAIYVSKKR